MKRTMIPLLLALALPVGAAEPDEEALDAWLERQGQIKTWSADVVQTRRLRSLTRALQSRGRVWFVRPNRFRWEIGREQGSPPRTIAVRTGEELLVAYPRLEHVERYRYDEQQDPGLRQALDLLEVGLPADPQAFHARYELLRGEQSEGVWRFELEPRHEEARRLIERVRLEVATEDSRLLATELVFANGSELRNEFSNHRLDPDLPDDLFAIE